MHKSSAIAARDFALMVSSGVGLVLSVACCGKNNLFHVLDAFARKSLSLREIFLIARDTSLFSKKYCCSELGQKKDNLIKSVPQNIRRTVKNYCLLWHNSSCHK